MRHDITIVSYGAILGDLTIGVYSYPSTTIHRENKFATPLETITHPRHSPWRDADGLRNSTTHAGLSQLPEEIAHSGVVRLTQASMLPHQFLRANELFTWTLCLHVTLFKYL